MNYKGLQYRVKSMRRREYVRPDTTFDNYMNLPIGDNEPKHKTSFERWVDGRNDTIKFLSTDEQIITYNFMIDSLKKLSTKKNFTINFSDYDNVNYVVSLKLQRLHV